jgi:hypothetical protein
MKEGSCLLGAVPTRTGTIALDLTFGTGFTLGEPVSLVEVFRLFKLEQNFFGVGSVNRVGRCTTFYLLAGPARLSDDLFCLSCQTMVPFVALLYHWKALDEYVVH